MSRKSVTTALTLYRSGTFTLEQAAGFSGLSRAEVATALGSRGIEVREADRVPAAEVGR